MNNIRLSFDKYNISDGIFEYNYVNTTIARGGCIVNFYKMLSFYKKSDIEEILINSFTIKEIACKLNKIGFYLYMFRRLNNINYFYIVKNTNKNKLIYDDKATLLYINGGVNVINNDKKDVMDLSDLD